jgi:hypothetical protein
MMKSEFETWPATPVEASLQSMKILSAPDLAEVASFLQNEAAGVGRPSEKQRSLTSELS